MVKTSLVSVLILFLVIAHAEAYRTNRFQVRVSGTGHDMVEFSGWCDVEIGNRELGRTYFNGLNDETAPVEIHGRYIDSCEVLNDSSEGEITLVIEVNGVEKYRRTTNGDEMKILYGPVMQRYNSRPPTMR